MDNSSSYRPSTGTPPIVKSLIFITVACWLLVMGVLKYTGIDLGDYFALYNWNSDKFRPWQLLTYLFLHNYDFTSGSSVIMHIFFNMLGLWMFGSVLERYWGARRFLFYFLVTGIGAGIINMIVMNWQLAPMLYDRIEYISNPGYEAFDAFVSNYLPGSYNNDFVNSFLTDWYYDQDNPGYLRQSIEFVNGISVARSNTATVGSSGAIYGLLLAFGMLFPNAMIMMLFPPIPMRAKYFVIVFGAIELIAGLRNNIDDNVGHFAHLGGMLFGIILILYWKKKDRERERNMYYYE